MKNSGTRGSSGSHRHSESIGPGTVAGAGQTQPRGPGKMGPGMSDDMYPSAKAGPAPTKVSNRTRGQEEQGE